MIRRDFIKTTPAAFFLPLGLITRNNRFSANPDDVNQNFPKIVRTLISQNDEKIGNLIKSQQQDKSSRWYGGIMDPAGIHTPNGTAHFIKRLSCAYVSPNSKYYESEMILECLNAAAKYLLNVQHADGTIDLLSTNFHSPPDTGFAVEPVSAALGLLNKPELPQVQSLKSNLKTFLVRAGEALTVGGIHTPNHRWVVCMALARIYSLFPAQKYLNRIDEWLQEKIDIDPDGQFTEKSSSIYSPLTDRCLITIARLIQKEELLEPVRKNLEMTWYYVHPSGELVTAASRRQDQFRRASLAPYYYPCRFMAIRDSNGLFAAMTKLIEKTALPQLDDQLVYFLEDKLLNRALPELITPPRNYKKIFYHSGLARIRRDQVSATVLAKNESFFSFHKNKAVLEAVRFASSFFGKGQFRGDELEMKDEKFILRQHLSGPYYQPFPKDKLPGDGDWHKMPRSLRAQSEIQKLESVVIISEDSGRFLLEIQIDGTENVPVSVELAFRKSGSLRNVREIDGCADCYLLPEGFGSYSLDGDTIHFGPGLVQHRGIQLRGALPRLNGKSVYLTGFTPLNLQLKIF